jgi:cystathionine beta-lyase
LREAIVADLWNKYAWRSEPQELIFLPGVESGFNMALKALVQPQQNVVVQVPNYPPLRHAPGHWGLNKVELEFEAQPTAPTHAAGDVEPVAARWRRAAPEQPAQPAGQGLPRAELRPLPTSAWSTTPGSSPTRSTPSCASTAACTFRPRH